MAIRIPILTSFDPKGLKQANAQLGKLRGSIGSLGKNFAVAGAVIAGAGALIGRAVADAAESQKVFAQTEAVLKSMGTTANGTAQDIANLASSLQKSTAFSDEAILAGQNLLLTFKNIQNQAGAGNDIFDQTSTLMLDVARAMGTTASGEAIRLGKALNDPVKGISALTRVGIQFTDQQKEQIKALAESGDLMGAQKIILAELQQQFGGSAAAYAQTFSGQLEGLNNDLNDMSEEIGFMVMPALQGMIAEFRDLIPIIGPQLKAAIESVDWKALTQSVIGFTTFLIQNATTIANVVVGIFALNTAFKLMQVAIGITNVAIALKTWYLAQLTTGMTAATIAAGKLRTALLLGGVVAGVAAVITEYARLKTAIDNSNTSLSRFNTESIAITGAVAKLDPITTAWQRITIAILGAVTAQKQFNNQPAAKPGRTSVLDSYAYNLKSGQPTPGKDPIVNLFSGGGSGGGGGKKKAQNSGKDWLNNWKVGFAREAARMKQQQEVAKILANAFPAPEGFESLGQNIGNVFFQGLNRALQSAGASTKKQAENLVKFAEPFFNKMKALQERILDRENFKKQLKTDLMDIFSFDSAKRGLKSLMSEMKKSVEQLRTFRDNINRLVELGLDPELLRKITDTKDFSAAAELVKGGSSAISEMNSLYGELSGFATSIGTQLGDQFYNLGRNMNGTIRTLEQGQDALKAQFDLEMKIKRLRTSLTSAQLSFNFDSITGIDYDERKARLAEIAAMKLELDTLKAASKNIRTGLAGVTNLDQSFLQTGKVDPELYEALYGLQNFGRGAQQPNMRSAASYVINVNGGLATSAEIGRLVVQSIRQYERANGLVNA